MKRDPKQVLTEFLVLSAQGGDEAAFRQLYQLWNPDLSRLAQAHIASASAVPEVVSDAWLNIARSVSRLDDPARFPRWAFRIVERRSADWMHSNRVLRELKRVELLLISRPGQE